jgi:hypothetical protein
MRDVDCAACNDGGNAGILKGDRLYPCTYTRVTITISP